MSQSYPYYFQLVTFGIGLGLCVGCEVEQPSNFDRSEVISVSETHNEKSQAESTPSVNTAHAIPNLAHLDYPFYPVFDADQAESSMSADEKAPFTMDIDRAEIVRVLEGAELLPSGLTYLKIDDLGGVHPIELDWLTQSNVDYEIYIDIVEPEYKQKIGSITQLGIESLEIVLNEQLLSNVDYLVQIEVAEFNHDEVWEADGLIRFDPVPED